MKLSDLIIFTTREYATRSKLAVSSASRRLNRLADRGEVTSVTRGIWCHREHPYFTPLALVPYLLGNEQGYVSFLTVLHEKGLVSQIPGSYQIASTGHSRKLQTPVGSFHFIQLNPRMMRRGIEWAHTRLPYRKATTEKAFLDTLYISTRKRKRFIALPELHFDDISISQRKLRELVGEQVRSPRIAAAIQSRLTSLGIRI